MLLIQPSRFYCIKINPLSLMSAKCLFLPNYPLIFFLGFVVPCIFNNSNKTPDYIQQSIVKCYCFVVQTLLNMFRAVLCPSSGARQTAVAAFGFRMNVEVDVFSAVVGPHSYGNQRLQRQFDGLLMMGIIMPETC